MLVCVFDQAVVVDLHLSLGQWLLGVRDKPAGYEVAELLRRCSIGVGSVFTEVGVLYAQPPEWKGAFSGAWRRKSVKMRLCDRKYVLWTGVYHGRHVYLLILIGSSGSHSDETDSRK